MSAKGKLYVTQLAAWATPCTQTAPHWLIYWYFNNIIIWNWLMPNNTELGAHTVTLLDLSSPPHHPAQPSPWLPAGSFAQETEIKMHWVKGASPYWGWSTGEQQTGNKVRLRQTPMPSARLNWPEKEWRITLPSQKLHWTTLIRS